MTFTAHVQIADHRICFRSDAYEHHEFIKRAFGMVSDTPVTTSLPCDLEVAIVDTLPKPFTDFSVDVVQENGRTVYVRTDYRLEVDDSFDVAILRVHDLVALKHALMNLYSAFIVHHRWGLLIHSSCVMDSGEAHLFAGPSGAGKSTVARLSWPRRLLSDEATVVQVDSQGAWVYDSPFRSDAWPPLYLPDRVRLSSINLLVQAHTVKRDKLSTSEGLLDLVDKIFYWPKGSQDYLGSIRLLQRVAQAVPTYRLYFQANPSFWEAIS